jgi:hypothetical protein
MRDHRRDDPELDFAEPELCGTLRDCDVATGDEAAAAAERMTLDPRDHGCRAAVDSVEHRAQP